MWGLTYNTDFRKIKYSLVLTRQSCSARLYGILFYRRVEKTVTVLLPSLPLCVCRGVLFSPDGSCLYSGSEDTLRVYGWEPDRCFDVVHVGWGKVADFAICNHQMVSGLLIFSLFISFWEDSDSASNLSAVSE